MSTAERPVSLQHPAATMIQTDIDCAPYLMNTAFLPLIKYGYPDCVSSGERSGSLQYAASRLLQCFAEMCKEHISFSYFLLHALQ